MALLPERGGEQRLPYFYTVVICSLLFLIFFFTDNVSDNINRAKAKAAEANHTATKVEATLTDIKKNLEQWKNKYGNMRNEDVNKAVEEAKTSG